MKINQSWSWSKVGLDNKDLSCGSQHVAALLRPFIEKGKLDKGKNKILKAEEKSSPELGKVMAVPL